MANGGTQIAGNAFGQGGNGSGNGSRWWRTDYGEDMEVATGARWTAALGYIGGVPEIIHNGTTYSPSTAGGENDGNGHATITFVSF